MNLKQATLEKKLAKLRNKWTKANRTRRTIIELQAKPLRLALDKNEK